jgi:hypothetical protein
VRPDSSPAERPPGREVEGFAAGAFGLAGAGVVVFEGDPSTTTVPHMNG